MKKLTLSGLFLLTVMPVFSQVGIGTTNPQETLHIAGTFRVENLSTSVTATKLGGMDANGTFREIGIDQSLELTNNTLAIKREYKFEIASVELGGGPSQNNLDLQMGPGLLHGNKDLIILTSSSTHATVALNSLESSGLENGRRVILLFKPSGNNNQQLQIVSGSGNGTGAEVNKFLAIPAGSITLNRNGMIELVYSTDLQRWIILSSRP